MRQNPNPDAQPNDPAAWITTCTVVEGSSDPKTVEMLATVKARNISDEITTLGPGLVNFLLLPDGELTSDLSLAVFDVDWMRNDFERLVADRSGVILYWGPRMPPSWVWALEEKEALRRHRILTGES
jgi:hypothetical protein